MKNKALIHRESEFCAHDFGKEYCILTLWSIDTNEIGDYYLILFYPVNEESLCESDHF